MGASYQRRVAERDMAYDSLTEIRRVTDAAGAECVPFLDDAVRCIVAERDELRVRVQAAPDPVPDA